MPEWRSTFIDMIIERYHQAVSEQMMQLLLLADPDRGKILDYLPDAIILVCRDKGQLSGIILLLDNGDVWELKNIAVAEAFQGQGIAKQLIKQAQQLAKCSGASQMEVGTGNSSFSQLAMYQKCDFRIQRVEQDYFLSYPEPIIENGIRCIDMVWLRAEL